MILFIITIAITIIIISNSCSVSTNWNSINWSPLKLHSHERFQIGHCHWRQVTDAIGNSLQEPDSYES